MKRLATNQPQHDTNKNSQIDVGIGAGLAIGAGIGVALGVAMDNIPLGLSIGTGCGLSIGIAIGNSTNRNQATLPEYSTIREKGIFALVVMGIVLLVATFATFLLVNSSK
jgi:F0F1-type ATP synthase assembly protein I